MEERRFLLAVVQFDGYVITRTAVTGTEGCVIEFVKPE